MKKYITFKKAKTHYEVFYNDRVLIGELIAADDGPYVFWRDPDYGFWPAYILREIADKLDELNAPLEARMEEFFQKQKESDDKKLNDHMEYLGSE